MISQKSQLLNLTGGGWFRRELKFLGLFLAIISFSNITLSTNTFALFVPTLSASVDQANLQVNGNQVIDSTEKTTEIPFNFTVNTNNRTGYTATLSVETENTALTNTSSATGAKIDSVSTNLSLNNLPNNTWGYKFGGTSNYAPIPALSTPAQIVQTLGRTNGNESSQLSIGMKLADNLESGNYTNKLILSFVSNPYTMRAMMTNGSDFNTKIRKLSGENESSISNGFNNIIYSIERSNIIDQSKNLISVDEPDSDYQIFAWFDNDTKTIKFYSEGQKIFLNSNSSKAFIGLKELHELDMSNFDTSNVNDMSRMFAYLENIENLDLSNFGVKNVKNMEYMFIGMTKIQNLNLNWENESDVTNTRGMFSGLKLIKSLNLSNLDTRNVVNMSAMFENMSSLENIQFGEKFITKNVTTMGGMFSNDVELKTLDLSRFNTSNVANMEYMFSHASKLTNLNLSSFNTSKVTNMSNMFFRMYSLTSLNLSSFDTSKVIDMNHMFSEASKLISLDLSSFDTSNVTNMRDMFSCMHSLASLNLSNFNTSQVVNMSYMFCYTLSLTSLNLSNFITSNVTDMSSMFYIMPNLTSLDLSNFDTSKVTNMARIFSDSDGYEYDDKLEKIYVNNDFDISKLTDDSGMFKNRKKLRGGNGSYLADPSTVDKSWLRIDDPAHGRPGYFTRKP